jgi:hypothetical protein
MKEIPAEEVVESKNKKTVFQPTGKDFHVSK